METSLVLSLACAVGSVLSVVLGCPFAKAAEVAASPGRSFFTESFDDSRLLQRGWYDEDKFTIVAQEAHTGSGCIEFRWADGASVPTGCAGMRRLFEPTETVHLRFHMRLSNGWGWTGRGYHPHLIQFMTTENDKWRGPASSHLTVYVEPWEGRLRLAAQDLQNQDQPHGLTQGPLRGGFNGQLFDSAEPLFTDDQWHCIEAMFQLNTLDLKADKPNPDGIVRAWFDGRLVVDRTNVVLRSTDFPKMKFNQFLLKPYFAPRLLPHAQTLWIDELAVVPQRLAPVGGR